MLIMGGNPAENHPCGFKWAIEAKRNRNAKMIVVDPRFTRTAATADLYLQIRAGTDIAFLGGLIRYAIENNRIAKDYLVNYTNAAFIIKDGFKLPEDGLYSGFDAATQDLRQVDLELRRRRGPEREATWRRTPAAHPAGSCQADGARRRTPPPPAAACRKRGLRSFAAASALRVSASADSSTRATRRRWWSASPAFRRTNF